MLNPVAHRILGLLDYCPSCYTATPSDKVEHPKVYRPLFVEDVSRHDRCTFCKVPFLLPIAQKPERKLQGLSASIGLGRTLVGAA